MTARFNVSTLTHDEVTPPSASNLRWDMAALSAEEALDDRSIAATAFANRQSAAQLQFKFSVTTNTMLVNGQVASFGKLCAQISGTKRLLIEATSLTYPELLYLFAAATREKVKAITFLYVEPKGYRRPVDERLCDHRNFNLSQNRRFRAIPKFMTNLNEIETGQAVFFLGYEGARLGQALQQEELLQAWKKHVVFGVPAFESAWEIDAIANNVDHLSTGDQVRYAAASSASAAYRLLTELRTADKEARPILVAPLGTKPHAIGAALFLIEHDSMDQAVLLYDHPERSQGRTEEVRRWHLYEVTDTFLAT